jgi:hypothetical protein
MESIFARVALSIVRTNARPGIGQTQAPGYALAPTRKRGARAPYLSGLRPNASMSSTRMKSVEEVDA